MNDLPNPETPIALCHAVGEAIAALGRAYAIPDSEMALALSRLAALAEALPSSEPAPPAEDVPVLRLAYDAEAGRVRGLRAWIIRAIRILAPDEAEEDLDRALDSTLSSVLTSECSRLLEARDATLRDLWQLAVDTTRWDARDPRSTGWEGELRDAKAQGNRTVLINRIRSAASAMYQRGERQSEVITEIGLFANGGLPPAGRVSERLPAGDELTLARVALTRIARKTWPWLVRST